MVRTIERKSVRTNVAEIPGAFLLLCTCVVAVRTKWNESAQQQFGTITIPTLFMVRHLRCHDAAFNFAPSTKCILWLLQELA